MNNYSLFPNNLEEFADKTVKINRDALKTLNYLGNKSRMMDSILEVILQETSKEDVICDLFAGSGSVTQALSSSRAVIAVDIQAYSAELIKSICNINQTLELKSEEIIEAVDSEFSRLYDLFSDLIEYEKLLLSSPENSLQLANFIENSSLIKFSLGCVSPLDSKLNDIIKETVNKIETYNLDLSTLTTTWNFGGVYFSFEHTLFIDSLLNTIQNKKIKNFKGIALSLASKLVNTIGKQFAQPLNPWDKNGLPKKNIFKKANSDRNLDARTELIKIMEDYLSLPVSNYPVESWTMDFKDALENLPSKVSFIYADPPYTRDHYSRFYHVLETLVLQDSPKISYTKKNGNIEISKGLYREDRHQSPFCIRSTAPKSFDDLFRIASSKNCKILLSYSPFEEDEHPRVMKLKDILELANKYFSVVTVSYINSMKHNKLNHTSKSLKRELPSEMLILCKDPI
ncbi:DNA adenine methylase [Acinetobacter pittii]|uniref:DNA adenine methylase n=1 Tax=Acinetobacter pittii TaxID=48296 RepID=UPI001F334DB2|nr:DNA adenine methylase [Acinetobacter pittii]MDA2253323.1 DNA adenine methylase [Bacillus cereus]MCE6238521.1 DNA adenine methylase [Acinetobacter pittii]MCE6693273.1 DNA adenine methylase [Acinetobacter pittii]MCE6700727.1 DNA adenine methylase [Acinetobacter pittii]WLE90685.1 Modification methylase FokI [Acinetobacter pittii]